MIWCKLRFHSAGYVVYEAQPPCARRYIVQPGDTCISIALRTQVPTYVNTLDSFFAIWPDLTDPTINPYADTNYSRQTQDSSTLSAPICALAKYVQSKTIFLCPGTRSHLIMFLFQSICLGILGHQCPRVYTVRPGDTCNSIAEKTDIPVGLLFAENPNINRPSCNDLQVNEVNKKQVFSS